MTKILCKFEDLEAEKILAIQKHLIDWYKGNKRQLPWRNTNNPYYIWISEVMLQQTKVDTVIDYYNRFIRQFPEVEDLANADEEQILKAWEGLGYYSRAKRLQESARIITEKYKGKMPSLYEEILALPGIGPYTAGAIASIAFHQPVPAVDGNVMRVFSRLFYIKEDISLNKTKEIMQKIGEGIVSPENPSFFNQGLMELGALICTPKSPRCMACPLYKLCKARESNVQEELPIKSKKKKPREVIMEMAFVYRDESMLITKRPASGLLGGLWALPSVEKEASLQHGESIRLELMESYGMEITDINFSIEKAHIFTHIKWKMMLYKMKLVEAKEIDYPQVKWIHREELKEFPLPTAFKKLLD